MISSLTEHMLAENSIVNRKHCDLIAKLFFRLTFVLRL